MKVSLLRPVTEVSDHFWEDWDALNTHFGDHHPLLQSRMVKLLTAHFPSELEALSITESGQSVALILARRPDRNRPLIRAGYLPSQSQIALVQIHPDCIDLRRWIFRALPFTCQRFDLLFVDSAHQPWLAQAEGAERSTRGLDMCINLSGDFEHYWNSRPRTLRKNISRYQNRVKREIGDLRFEVISSLEAVQEAVDRYGLLENQGWKGASNTALHPDNKQGRFYRALLHDYAKTDEAIVFELYHQDRLVASRLTIHNSRMLVILKTTFSEDYKRYAVGRLLLYHVIQHLFAEDRMKRIEFYTRATPEQLEWATESRPTHNVSFYRYPVVSSIAGLLRRQSKRS